MSAQGLPVEIQERLVSACLRVHFIPLLMFSPSHRRRSWRDLVCHSLFSAWHRIYPFIIFRTTCSKMDWLIDNGEYHLRPEKRRNNTLLLYKRAEVHYEPLGVVAAIVSWNYRTFAQKLLFFLI